MVSTGACTHHYLLSVHCKMHIQYGNQKLSYRKELKMMDTDKGLFIVNKKAKEIRDILQLVFREVHLFQICVYLNRILSLPEIQYGF